MPRKCFVISPIDKPGTDVREHANDVFDHIIKPAMDELKIDARRGDHFHQMGRVTDQMFESILTDDLCIAVLTFRNPNVYYELAIAQSAARPVIILVQHGQELPFDVRDLRVIYYDLSPRPERNRRYVEAIVKMVSGLDAVDWKAEVPFGSHLSPLGAGRGELTAYAGVEHYGPSERWLGVLRNATSAIDLLGVSLRWWNKLIAFAPLLSKKAAEGCVIRLMLMHPENPVLPGLVANRTAMRRDLPRLSADIEDSFALLSKLAADAPNLRVRQLRVGFPYQLITRGDDRMLVSLSQFRRPTAQCPLLECTRLSPLFTSIASAFDELWDLNAPPAPEGMPA